MGFWNNNKYIRRRETILVALFFVASPMWFSHRSCGDSSAPWCLSDHRWIYSLSLSLGGDWIKFNGSFKRFSCSYPSRVRSHLMSISWNADWEQGESASFSNWISFCPARIKRELIRTCAGENGGSQFNSLDVSPAECWSCSNYSCSTSKWVLLPGFNGRYEASHNQLMRPP